MNSLKEPAAAKINLALHVVGQRNDGYHLIDTLVAFTRFGDTISVSNSDNLQLEISGPFGERLATDNSNLVLRAAEALQSILLEQTGLDPLPGAHILLEKNLPLASGIGGGSADAAATLRALIKIWEFKLEPRLLNALAARLGADVPMCLMSRSLIARGIGDELTRVPLPRLYLVLVNPGTAVSTPDIFGSLAVKTNAPLPALPEHLDRKALIGFLRLCRNDLQDAAISAVPIIAGCLDALSAQEGCELARMSGSGATCFGIFVDAQSAQNAADQLATSYPDWWIIATETL